MLAEEGVIRFECFDKKQNRRKAFFEQKKLVVSFNVYEKKSKHLLHQRNMTPKKKKI